MEEWYAGNELALTGFPGTGKTFLALYLGLQIGRVKIIRSVVPSRDMGFLPGDAEEKAAVYEAPYKSICSDLYGRGDAWGILKHRGMVEFETTSFLRGQTMDGTTIIVDECQNLGYQELKTAITRVGGECRVIFCGDTGQNDLAAKSGWPAFEKVLLRMLEFSHVSFRADDIVRSGLVKSFILAENET